MTLPARRGRRRMARLGLNLTSMIDVVFLLLVYFMAVTEFKPGEEVYRLDLPQRGRTADPFELPLDPIRITVTSVATGDYVLHLAGPPGAGPRPATFRQLVRFLSGNLRRDRAAGGLFEADHPIIIEPTGRTSWAHAMGAFNAAVRARYTNITFASP
ncbi:MAG: biopolymer transporter ExbD [Planctomycetes bacterium]|nr:biopolymer transporter ExbD [Planctomycetota bacterium]